jgi:hypothetical protein
VSLVLVVLTNPVEGREDEFNEWYSGRHLDDVLAVEGFTAAQRFKLVDSKLSRGCEHRYLAIYEADHDDAERAETALFAAAGTDAMPISEAMAKPQVTWFFQTITDRVEA